jgi:protein phosphatase 2C family protein 2/3
MLQVPAPVNRRRSVLQRLGLVSDTPTSPNVPVVMNYSYFSVIDGHAGVAVAERTSDRLHHVVSQQSEFAQSNYVEAMRKGFIAMDEELRSDPVAKDSKSGACVTGVWVVGKRVIVSNVGDARAVMVVAGGKPVRVTVDHEPETAIEKTRITAAGGTVDYDGRLGGYIAVSRSLGDFIGKQHPRLTPDKQMISCIPDVVDRPLDDKDEFVVIASDGTF